MKKAEDFILGYDGEQKAILLHLHHLLTVEFGLTDRMRYDLPFYYGRSWICYLHPAKEGTIELSFTRGSELSNLQGLLDSKGRKQVSSITFKKLSDIPSEEICEIIQESILLDETTPYAFQGKSRKT